MSASGRLQSSAVRPVRGRASKGQRALGLESATNRLRGRRKLTARSITQRRETHGQNRENTYKTRTLRPRVEPPRAGHREGSRYLRCRIVQSLSTRSHSAASCRVLGEESRGKAHTQTGASSKGARGI